MDLDGDQSSVHGPRGPWLQAPQLAEEDCMVSQARVGIRARSLVVSSFTRPSKYAPIGAAALRLLTVRARSQTILAFERLI